MFHYVYHISQLMGLIDQRTLKSIRSINGLISVIIIFEMGEDACLICHISACLFNFRGLTYNIVLSKCTL
jgi:hypothetical protein